MALTGRTQVNFNPVAYGTDHPFINVAKTIDRVWTGGGATEDVMLLLDDQGYPTKMPAGVSQLTNYITFYRPTDASDPWVLTWDGVGTVNLGGSQWQLVTSGKNTVSANRIEWTLSYAGTVVGDTLSVQIEINATTEGNHVRNIKLFRKSHETLLNAGEILAPHFVDFYKDYGVVRFLDWSFTNSSPEVSWNNRAPFNHASWAGGVLLKNIYCGKATVSGNDYTAAGALTGNPSTWTNGMSVQITLPSMPVFKTVSNITKANPAVVTATGHGYTTGDKVIFRALPQSDFSFRLESNRTDGNPFVFIADPAPAWTITVLDANTFSLNGVNSTAWSGTPTSGTVAKQIRAKAGNLPFKRITTMALENLYFDTLSSVANIWTLVYDADYDALMMQPQAFTGKGHHVPYEVMIALANKLQAHPWFCIPHLADNNYVTQLATLVRDTLDTNLIARFEYSNEMWNFGVGFEQTTWALRKASLYWGLTGFDAWQQFYGYRASQVYSLITTVYAGQMNRVRRVVGVQTTEYNGDMDKRLVAPATGASPTLAAVSDYIALTTYTDATSGATIPAEYVWKYKQGGALRDEALAWLDVKWRAVNQLYLTVTYLKTVAFPTWATVCNSYTNAQGNHLKMTQYEGGFSGLPVYVGLDTSSYNGVSLNQNDIFAFYSGYYNSRYYGRVITELCNAFADAGGEYPAQYPLVGLWGTSGMWAMLQPNIFATPVVAYDDWRAFNAGKRRFKVT